MSDIIFGIDFGTTNSSLSVNRNGHVEVVDIDRFNPAGKTLKSIIYFDPEEKNICLGQNAINRYIYNDAYGRYIQSVKTFLPDQSFESTEIGRKNYKLEDLIGMILKQIKDEGEKYVGAEVDRVVLGRPVFFSENEERDRIAEQRLMAAARSVGFKDIHTQYEPIAAALAYESRLPAGEEKIIFVGDFGGGTSDFTIIKVRGGDRQKGMDRKKDVLSLGGVYIGGDTFDSQIMWEKIAYYFGKDIKVKSLMNDFSLGFPKLISGKLRRWHLIPQLRSPKTLQHIREMKQRADRPEFIDNLENLIEDNYGYMLFQAIEKAKVELSSQNESVIQFKDFKLKLDEAIARTEFETIIQGDLEKIKQCVTSTMSQADLSVCDIDAVFLTGGSSHISCIKSFFATTFGPEKINQTDAFTSVGYGLGLDAFSYM